MKHISVLITVNTNDDNKAFKLVSDFLSMASKEFAVEQKISQIDIYPEPLNEPQRLMEYSTQKSDST